jgi:hypothetical protein
MCTCPQPSYCCTCSLVVARYSADGLVVCAAFEITLARDVDGVWHMSPYTGIAVLTLLLAGVVVPLMLYQDIHRLQVAAAQGTVVRVCSSLAKPTDALNRFVIFFCSLVLRQRHRPHAPGSAVRNFRG